MVSRLYERTLYRNKDIEFLFGSKITEYDIKSAGLSLIKYFKLLNEDTISELDLMTKQAKNIKIGLIQKHDREFMKKLSQAFIDARKMFFEANNIPDEKVLSIRKDAIFLIDMNCENTRFGPIVFDSKNTYTSYIYLNKLDFYINTYAKKIDIKGLGQGENLEEVIELHGKYLLDFIMKIVHMKEMYVDNFTVVRYLTNFIKLYRTKQLPIEYYRQLDRGLSYLIYDNELGEYVNIKETTDIDSVDISKNYFDIIVPLASLYT